MSWTGDHTRFDPKQLGQFPGHARPTIWGDTRVVGPGETIRIPARGDDSARQWKLMLGVVDTQGTFVHPASAVLLVEVTTQTENARITRNVAVTSGDFVYLYAPGRALTLTVLNVMAAALTFVYQIVEEAPGIARYTVREHVNVAPGILYTPITVPPFCTAIQVFCRDNTNVYELGTFYQAGLVLSTEVLATPRSAEINRYPGAVYGLRQLAGADPIAHVLYLCQG